MGPTSIRELARSGFASTFSTALRAFQHAPAFGFRFQHASRREAFGQSSVALLLSPFETLRWARPGWALRG